MQEPEDDESWLEMMKWPVCLENEKSEIVVSKKSPTGPTERTRKPEYLITLPTYLGVRW